MNMRQVPESQVMVQFKSIFCNEDENQRVKHAVCLALHTKMMSLVCIVFYLFYFQ